MTRENKFARLANLLLVMLMSASISQTLYTSLFMTPVFSLTIFLLVIPFTLLFFVMFRNKLSGIISLIGTLALLIAGASTIIFYIGMDNIIFWCNRYSIWFVDLTNGFRDISVPLFFNATIITLTFLITLFVFIFTIKIYNFYITTILFFSIFFIQLQLNVAGSIYAFVLFIFSFMLYYFFLILQRRSREKTYDAGNRLKYLLYLLPVCIIVLVLNVSLFPLNQARISLPWLDTKIDKTFDSIINKFSGMDVSSFDYFSFGVTGFGKSDRLGGNLKLSNTRVMDVKTSHSNLYLRATSKVQYDGHRWYDDEVSFTSLGASKEFSDKLSSDAELFYRGLFTANDLSGRIDLKKNDYFENSKAEIKLLNMETKSLFLPSKTYRLMFPALQQVTSDTQQMLSTKEPQNKGFSYSFEYISPKLGNKKLIDLLRKSHTGSDTDISYKIETGLGHLSTSAMLNKHDSAVIMVKSLDSLEAKEIPASAVPAQTASIYEKYTQLPATITPRVKKLAEDLTKELDNNYDKSKAIETYLSKNYPYTLVPGNPPRTRDFVDYFLFEGKKGYCTYYASAMTVLLRCIDIPARYVEGYILPPETKDGVYQVTNQQAHAWVEVYFNDYGWIPFEPTSPFVANLYADRSVSATVSSEMLDTSYQEYMEMMNKYRNQSASIGYEPDYSAPEETGINKPLLILIISASLIGVIILVILVLAALNYFRFYKLQRKIRKSEPTTAMLLAYSYILRALKQLGVNIIPGETPSQFGDRVEKHFDIKGFSFNKTSFTIISGYYVKARYSRNPITVKEIEQTLEFIDILLELIQEKSGRFRLGFSRYILGRF